MQGVKGRMKPVRIQRKRVKGYNMQSESRALNGLPAVSVCRPGRWGNPYKVGALHPKHGKPMTASEAVSLFKEGLFKYTHTSGSMHDLHIDLMVIREIKRGLAGKNLACWCKLDAPCHADVLLEIANDKVGNRGA